MSGSVRWRGRASLLIGPFTFVLLIFAYIWIIQPLNSTFVDVIALIGLTAIPPVSQVLRREDPRELGFRLDNFGRSAREIAFFTGAGAVALIAFALLSGRGLIWHRTTALSLLTYPVWAFIQQYALQSYVHRGLRRAWRNTRLSSAASALVFASLHFPNPVLMVMTALAGYGWCRSYARTPNLFTLALSHGWLAVVLWSTIPDAWVHNLHIGPGFWSYGP